MLSAFFSFACTNARTLRAFLHVCLTSFLLFLQTKIKEVHQASISGDLEALEAKADQGEMLLAKDHNGLNPLHRVRIMMMVS